MMSTTTNLPEEVAKKASNKKIGVQRSKHDNEKKEHGAIEIRHADGYHNNPPRNKRQGGRGKGARKQRSASDLLSDLLLSNNKENNWTGSISSLNDLRENPDLWLAAFDEPLEFIQFCRKRLEHQRTLLDNSRKVENEILEFVKTWADNASKREQLLNDFLKVQQLNEKLHMVVMEERTHCQHLVGENDRIETQRKIMTRKYEAALLLGKVDDRSVNHLLEKNSKAVALVDRLTDTRERATAIDDLRKGGVKRDPEVPQDHLLAADVIVNLKNQITSMKAAHREEVDVLKETIAHNDLKYEALKTRYTEILQETTKAVENTRDMLNVSVSQNLILRSDLLKKEDLFWTKQKSAIKTVLGKQVQLPETRFSQDICEPFVETSEAERELKQRLARTEIELEEKSKVLFNANSRLLEFDSKRRVLEDAVEKLKKSHNSTVAALKSRNEILEKRCEKSEQRRKLDNAGFRHELDELKYLLKQLEKTVSKCTKAYGDSKKMQQYQVPTDEELRHMVKSGVQQQRVLSGATRGAGGCGTSSGRGIVAASGPGGAVSAHPSRGSGRGAGTSGGEKWHTDQPPPAMKNLQTGDHGESQVNSEATKLLIGYMKRQIKDLERKKNFEFEKDDDLNKMKVLFKNPNKDKYQHEDEVSKPTKTQKTRGDVYDFDDGSKHKDLPNYYFYRL